MKINLIGHGKWGQIISKNISQFFPNIELTISNKNNYLELSKNSDGIIICTQPQYHIPIALEILNQNPNKCILIEKPLSLKYSEVLQLDKYPNILINYIHIFSDIFQDICNKISISEIKNIKSVGCGNGPIRDYSPLLDYGSHDIAMSIWLTQSLPMVSLKNIKKSDNKELYTFDLHYENFDHNIITGNNSTDKIRTFKITLKNNKFLEYSRENNIDIFRTNKKTIKYEDQSTLKNSIQNFINMIEEKSHIHAGIPLSFGVQKIIEQIL